MIITVIHEVRWLPNEVEAKLDRLAVGLKMLDEKIDELTLLVKEDNKAQIQSLADDVKAVRDKLQTSVNNQQQ